MSNSLRVLHPQWRDEFEATPYPFGDWATLHNDEGTFIQEGTLLDASLYPAGGGVKLRLSKVIVSDQTIELHIGDDVSDSLASGTIDVLNQTDEIRLLDSYGRPAGIFVSTIERLLLFQTWSLGTHEFTFNQTGFTAGVHIPISGDYFQGFVLDDGSIVSGDIWLVGEDGIILSYGETSPTSECDPDADQLPAEQTIKVNIVGDPMAKKKQCGDSFTAPKILRSLTFRRGCDKIVVTPDPRGDIKVSAGTADGASTVLRVRSIDGKLLIETASDTQEG